HKFAILDDSRVWVGSANWTSTSFDDDANNAVFIEHAAVVDAFEAEFAQMVSSGNYGPDKRDVHPERFSVDGQSTEIRFGPTDNPRDRLVELIDNADESLHIAMNTLTDDPLSDAIRRARERGVDVDALWDFQSWDICQFAEAEEFVADGLGTWDALPGLLHHKFAVIDGETVVTGSANWSASGMERNDETVLIIHSPSIAEQFTSEFQDLRADARSYSDSATTPPRVELRHFQSVRSGALVQWRPRPMGAVERYEVCRLSSPETSECEATIERPGWAWYAVDRSVGPGTTAWYRVRGYDGASWSPYSNVYRADIPDDVPVLSAEEAKRKLEEFRGQTVSVRFRVVNEPTQTGENGHVFFNASDNYEADFTAFMPGCTMPRFNGSGLDLFRLQGERIEVTGELEEFDGGPEIVVTGPWQVRRLGN
ncbi:MAG: phospholipase D-like domain-containing protein, partial [Candidatus Bipolaricaulia bacterium]